MSKQGVLENFESYADEIIEEHKIPGVSIGINQNGEPL